MRVQQDVVAFGFHYEAIQLDIGIVIVFTGTAIVCPLVPRADDQVVLQITLTDRSSGMRANSRQRVQFATRIADRVGIFSERDFHH